MAPDPGPVPGVPRHRRRRTPPPRPAAHHGRPALHPRDWRVRTKLGAVLVIPALAFLVAAGLQANLSVRQAASLDAFAEQVALGRQVTALVHELQFERDWVSGQLAAAVVAPGGTGDRDQVVESAAPAREAVDAARAAFDRAVAPLRDRPGLRAAVGRAEAALDGLAVIRRGMAEGWLRQQAVFDGYTRAVDALLALLPAQSTAADAQVRGYQELAEVKELTAQLRGQLHAVVSAGGLTPGEAARLADLRAQRRAAQDRFRAAATPEQLVRFDEVVRGQAVRATARLEQAVSERAGAGGPEVAPQQWWSAATTELELFREVERVLLADVLAQVEQRSREQWRQTIAVTAVTLLTLLVSLLLSVGIGRSMVRSLRQLRGQAVEVAQVDLPGLLARLRTSREPGPVPEPVITGVVTSADEIGEVVEAFTQVHRSAVHLAVEQAQMRRNVNRIFVNLARRSQVLVERQLELLDDLERDETSPSQLDSLFQLDHLATRMRRHNDSLLVLTDRDPVRRYDEPVALSAVALAAIAEIERYQRVRDDVAGDLYVAGHVVTDLVHLFAELLDNATSFSAPDSPVTLAAERPPGSAGALVRVTDVGIGMSAAALAEANALLADPPAIDVASSERMGLVVVGHLAARHGVRVRLTAAAPGVTAGVWLPERLLAPAPEPTEADRSAAGADRPAAGAGAGPAGGEPATGGPTAAGSTAGEAAGAARAGQPAGPRLRTPRRAEDVLGEASRTTATREPPSVWWSRPTTTGAGQPAGAPTSGGGLGAPERPRPAGPALPIRPPVVTHRTSASGLPVRVPMAQLPPPRSEPVEEPPPPATDLDPEEVGSTLAAFYGGVHRAEAETPEDDRPTQEITPIVEDKPWSP